MRIFLKQYGARRTGTNYLRWLIQSNYSDADVVALMHILGDKHSPQAPLADLWCEAQAAADPAFTFAMKATLHAPADSTERNNPRQRNEVQRVAADLARAYVGGALGFLISVKDPYAWTVSVARFYCWTDSVSVLGPHLLDRLVAQCNVFNACYASWLALAGERPERCCVVRHEDLLLRPEAILDEVDLRFSLRRRAEAQLHLPDEADKVWWDQHKAVHTGIRFDRTYYVDKRYLDRLSPALRAAVTATIDWGQIAPLGYAPLGDGA